VTVSVTVTNAGGQSGSYEVTLKVNNKVVDATSITLAAGTSQKVTFTISRDTAGTYTANVNTISRDTAGTYTADINGKTATFVVKEAGTWWGNVIDTIGSWKDNIVDWWDNVSSWWDRLFGK